jgi:transcriptional regulator with GAF, ATPase, and Fis domain
MPQPPGAPLAELHRALASVARAIADSLEIREVWDRVAAACHTVVPFDAMGVARLEADGKVHAIAAAGARPLKAYVDQIFERTDYSPSFWPDEDEFIRVIRDVPRELDPAHRCDSIAINGGFRSAIRVSLSARGARLGSILLIAREPGRFSEEHGRTLAAVAELVAVVIAHQQLAATLAEETRRTASLEQRVEALSQELESLGRHRALGNSRAWRDVLKQATQVAPTETTVLLSGESGTGKEVARFIHRASPRRDGPFVALNCAALAEQLLESELFGHEKGAFTGAQAMRAGKLEQAAGGVLFLDEVGEMSPAVQAKFLRVLQEREFQRLGGSRTLKADVRVLAATNRDLKAAIARGMFREDLYYRLAVFDIAMPPLRERRDDILVLAGAFLEEIGASVGRPAAGIADDARERLAAHSWPGNVRELRNVIERAVILSEGGFITAEHLPLAVAAQSSAPVTAPAPFAASSSAAASLPFTTVEAAERDLIMRALTNSGQNKSKAARALGLTRAQLRSRIEKHGI